MWPKWAFGEGEGEGEGGFIAREGIEHSQNTHTGFAQKATAKKTGNTMILNTLRQSWQQQPSANTKRGKPHRATLKAGPWDEPPQLARALATGF